MLEFKIIKETACLVGQEGERAGEQLEIRCADPRISLVKLYCCESQEIFQSPLTDGIARFDTGVLRQGRTYRAEFIGQGGYERALSSPLKAFTSGGVLYLYLANGGITEEITKMWRAVALAFESAEQAKELCLELAKGYRTE